MDMYCKFKVGDRVQLVCNPPLYSKIKLGGTGTVRKVNDYPGGNGMLLVSWDAGCGLTRREQEEWWIETRFDFAEDEYIEAPASIGGLFE